MLIMDYTQLFEKVKKEYPFSFDSFIKFVIEKNITHPQLKEDEILNNFNLYDIYSFFSKYKIRAGVMPDINEWICVVMKGNEVRYARTGFFIDKDGDIKAREEAEEYSIIKCFEISEEILKK